MSKLFEKMQQVDVFEEWKDMPEFLQEDLTPFHAINVRFRNAEDMAKFAELVEQKVDKKTKTIWYPFAPFRRAAKFRYVKES